MNVFLVLFVGICLLLWVGAQLHAIAKRRRRMRYRVDRIDVRNCERAGSQGEFDRRLRAKGVR